MPRRGTPGARTPPRYARPRAATPSFRTPLSEMAKSASLLEEVPSMSTRRFASEVILHRPTRHEWESPVRLSDSLADAFGIALEAPAPAPPPPEPGADEAQRHASPDAARDERLLREMSPSVPAAVAELRRPSTAKRGDRRRSTIRATEPKPPPPPALGAELESFGSMSPEQRQQSGSSKRDMREGRISYRRSHINYQRSDRSTSRSPSAGRRSSQTKVLEDFVAPSTRPASSPPARPASPPPKAAGGTPPRFAPPAPRSGGSAAGARTPSPPPAAKAAAAAPAPAPAPAPAAAPPRAASPTALAFRFVGGGSCSADADAEASQPATPELSARPAGLSQRDLAPRLGGLGGRREPPKGSAGRGGAARGAAGRGGGGRGGGRGAAKSSGYGGGATTSASPAPAAAAPAPAPAPAPTAKPMRAAERSGLSSALGALSACYSEASAAPSTGAPFAPAPAPAPAYAAPEPFSLIGGAFDRGGFASAPAPSPASTFGWFGGGDAGWGAGAPAPAPAVALAWPEQGRRKPSQASKRAQSRPTLPTIAEFDEEEEEEEEAEEATGGPTSGGTRELHRSIRSSLQNDTPPWSSGRSRLLEVSPAEELGEVARKLEVGLLHSWSAPTREALLGQRDSSFATATGSDSSGMTPPRSRSPAAKLKQQTSPPQQAAEERHWPLAGAPAAVEIARGRGDAAPRQGARPPARTIAATRLQLPPHPAQSNQSSAPRSCSSLSSCSSKFTPTPGSAPGGRTRLQLAPAHSHVAPSAKWAGESWRRREVADSWREMAEMDIHDDEAEAQREYDRLLERQEAAQIMASRSVSRSGTSVASSVAGSVPGSSIAGSSYGSWRKGRGSSCGALSGSWRRRHQHEGILFDQDPSRVADFGHAIERDEERGGQPPAAPSIGGSSRRSSLSSSNPNRRAGGRAGVDKADVDAGASAPKAFRNGPGLSLASVSAGGLRPSSMGGLKPIAEGDVSEGESQLSSTRGSWTSESTWSQSGTRRRRKRVNFSQRDSLVN